MEPRRVLFVSSDRTAASVLEHQLAPDFEVHAAASAEAAFALMDAYAYACVVVDRRAPAMTGISLGAITRRVITIDVDGDRFLDGVTKAIREG